MRQPFIPQLQEDLELSLREMRTGSGFHIPSARQLLRDSLDYLSFEDAELLSLLAEWEPAVIDALKQEHRLMNWRIRELLQECADENRLKKSMQPFCQKFGMFISFTLDLLEREASILDPIFHRYFPDDELMKMHLINCCPVKRIATNVY